MSNSESKPIVHPISSESELKSWLSKEDMLLILDLHLDWSGPCQVLIPFLEPLVHSFENVDRRLAFLSVDVSQFQECLEKILSLNSACILPSFVENVTVDCGVKMEQQEKEQEMVVVQEEEREEQEEKDEALLLETIGESSSTKKESKLDQIKIQRLIRKKGCIPMFVAIKAKEIIAIVDSGANYPAIEQIVKQFIPELSDEDNHDEKEQDGGFLAATAAASDVRNG